MILVGCLQLCIRAGECNQLRLDDKLGIFILFDAFESSFQTDTGWKNVSAEQDLSNVYIYHSRLAQLKQ